jgi:hypothetical protein
MARTAPLNGGTEILSIQFEFSNTVTALLNSGTEIKCY